jgi:hypothetical protein
MIKMSFSGDESGQRFVSATAVGVVSGPHFLKTFARPMAALFQLETLRPKAACAIATKGAF